MKAHFDNQVIASALLYLQNKISKKGAAFFSTSGYFYDVKDLYNGHYTFSSPFKPIIADTSISGIIPFTGVFLNNIFITSGQSGLVEIDYQNGKLYFNSDVGGVKNISGSYSVYEYNYQLTDKPEEQILFKDKYVLRPTTNQTLSGLASNETTYPIIYIRNNGSYNKGFAMGGEDLTTINLRVIVLTDSQFNLDATLGILRDLRYTHIPILSESEFPFNNLGGLRSGVYHFDNMTTGRVADTNHAFIDETYIAKYNLNVKTDLNLLPKNVFAGFCDLEVVKNRFPRA